MHFTALLLLCLALAAAATPDDEHEAKNGFEDDQYFDNKDKRDFPAVADDMYDDNPAKVRFEPVKCAEEMDNMDGVTSESLCSNPVDVYVNISENSLYSYAPTRMKVKRCGGVCSSRLACMPTGKTFVKRMVEIIMMSNQVKECAYAVVEQHTGCTCGCIIKAHQCKEKQTYNENACECECEDMENKKGACLHKGHSWRGNSCECRCPDGDQPCSPGYKWNTDDCKCEKKRMSSFKRPSSWRKYFSKYG